MEFFKIAIRFLIISTFVLHAKKALAQGTSDSSELYFRKAITYIHVDTARFLRYFRGGEISLWENDISAFSDKLSDSCNYYYAKCIYFGASNNLLDSSAFRKSFPFILRCANSGELDCQFWLGYMYDYGLGCVQDKSKGVEYYLKVASSNGNYSNFAKFNLASLYFELKNHQQAILWYKKLSDCSDSMVRVWALAYLGDFYLNGYGVAINFSEAIKYYKKSAEQGVGYAMYMLGIMYLNGKGVKMNTKEAKKWFNLAYNNGYEKALSELNNLE